MITATFLPSYNNTLPVHRPVFAAKVQTNTIANALPRWAKLVEQEILNLRVVDSGSTLGTIVILDCYRRK